MRGIFLKIKEKVRNYFSEVMKVHTKPHDVAMGFAIGVFLGIFPTPGLNIIFGLIAAALFNVNKVAIFAGIAVNNPLTAPIIYTTGYKVGQFFFGGPPIGNILSWDFLTDLSNLVALSKPIIVGLITFAVISSVIAYLFMYGIYYFFFYKRMKEKLPK